jgi:hypothetical protein
VVRESVAGCIQAWRPVREAAGDDGGVGKWCVTDKVAEAVRGQMAAVCAR